MIESNQNILVIDDDLEIWQAYKKVLEYRNLPETTTGKQLAALFAKSDGEPEADSSMPQFELSFASQGRQGFEMLSAAKAEGRPFSVAFIDVRMPPGWDGMETGARIRQIDPNVEIVIVTAYADRSREELVKTIGTPEKLLFLRKPFDPEELFQLALSLSEKWRMGRLEERARVALSESEARFRSLVETTPDFVWEMDLAGKFTYCSPVSEMIYGFRPDELLGQSFSEKLLNPEDVESYQNYFARGLEQFRFLPGGKEYRCRKKDGSDVYVEPNATALIDEDGNLVGFRGVDRDITERNAMIAEKNNLEEQFRQAQKMEALGTLAGGLAHDLNNLLTPIIGYTELSLLKIDPDSSLYDRLKIVTSSAKKAAELVSQVLMFSRKKTITPEIFEVNAVVRECIKMLGRMIREDIDLKFELADQSWPVYIDKGQVEQVLINLVVNGRDAISGNGTIVVKTENVSIPAGQALTDTGLNKFFGDFVVISVSDSGSGIQQDILEKIFEPFFTTKDVGKGTGLGLATVYGVVLQHDGHIVIDSKPGEGTTFHIYLPRSKKIPEVEVGEKVVKPIIGGSETILVVEDDPVVQELTVSLLEQMGYSVLRADNGLHATAVFDSVDGKVDALVTDVIMPQQGGDELAKVLREKKPELPIIFISGYDNEMISGEILGTPKTGYCRKPFKASMLAEMIRSMLD